MSLLEKIRNKFLHLRLQPIRVFCFHQVSEIFDSVSMWECDWMSTRELQNRIVALQKEGYTFISMRDAYRHLCNDKFRFRKYAVLTADDGSKTLENIMPWLHSQHIPLTLFINGCYLDGKSYREAPTEKYLTKEDVFSLTGSDIEIGNHSWDHRDLINLSALEFLQSIEMNTGALSHHPCYIPFWAYPYGTHTYVSDELLRKSGLVPVYMDGQVNYNETNCIHRELL